MNANTKWQEVISDNLASSSVPGFRKQQLSLEAVQSGLMSASGTASSTFVIPKSSTSTSFMSGDMQFTGNKNDVGIEGKSFFEVQLPNGNMAVTRDGEFQVNSQGQLVTKEGYAVMGSGGPIQLDPHNSEPLSISSNGDVSQGTSAKGKLKLTDFGKPELLQQISGSYFLASDPKVGATAGTGTLRDGYLEGSNTSVVGEMANMITAMRSFEANQHVVQLQDDRLGKTISELGTPQ